MKAIRSQRVATLALATVVYVLVARAGLSFALANASVTAVWPPTGLALGALLRFGSGLWPAVLLGAFVTNFTVTHHVESSAVIAVGNALEAVVGCALVNRYAAGRHAFERAATTWRFVLVVTTAPTILSATVGVAALVAGGELRPGLAAPTWLTWWLGDVVGALLFAPAVCLSRSEGSVPGDPRRMAELTLTVSSALLVTSVVFIRPDLIGARGVPLGHLVMPFAVWSAVRLGVRETSYVMLVVSMVAAWGTARTPGQFFRGSPHESLQLLQSYIAVMVVMALPLAASIAEGRAVREQLNSSRDDLERRVKERTMALAETMETLRAEVLERRRSESDLKRLMRELTDAQQAAQIGSWEWEVGPDRVHWSDEMYRLYGSEPQSHPVTYRAFLERVHPDDRSLVETAVRRSLETLEPFVFDHRTVRSDGSIRWLHARGRLLVGEGGRVERMVGTGQDITERKLAEIKFRGLVESAPDALVIVDSDGEITLVNAQTEKLFGYPRDELVGRPIEVLIPARFHSSHVAHRGRYVATSRARPMGVGLDLHGRRRDGSEFVAEVSLGPLETADGKLISAAVRDVSDRRRLEEALRRSLSEKDALLREVHHRAKNSLQVACSLVSLQSGTAVESSVKAALQEAGARIRSMALVHELVDRSENLARVDLGMYIRGLVQEVFVRHAVDPSVVRTALDVGDVALSLPTVVHLGLLINELVSNSVIHAFPDGRSGVIRVALSQEPDGSVELTVADDGVGLPTGLDFRSASTLGLRLAIVLTEQLSGTIEHLDTGGTTFCVVFQPPAPDRPAGLS